MDVLKQQSHVSQFRETCEQAHEGAKQGLGGIAIVASHKSITARMQRGAERILHLIAQGRHQQAQALLCSEGWNSDEQGGA